MTRVTDVRDLDPAAQAQLEADLEFITDYLAGEASVEKMIEVNERLRTDQRFYDNVAPLIEARTLPGRIGAGPGYDRHSTEARQAEVDRFMALIGRKSIPLEVWMQEAPDPAPNVPQRKAQPKKSKLRRAGLIVAMSLPGAVLGYCVRGPVDAWHSAVDDHLAGMALPLDATVFRPTMYETLPGEKRHVALTYVDVDLHESSRLAIGWWSGQGAIDGAADIAVHSGRTFAVLFKDIPIVLGPGRYQISHPLGGPSRIVVDSGFVQHHLDHYTAGTVISAVGNDTVTTFSVVTGTGHVLPPKRMKNYAIQP